jgi:inorganic pyrophosphatase
MNLWHDIPAGNEESIHVVIEVPKGSLNKYETDKDTGMIALDRANYSAAAYPCEYGFVPQTLWDDGDALDVLLLASFPIPSGIMVKARPIALMEMVDTGEQDNKLICVPVKDKRWDHVLGLSDINPHTLKELKHFFETYKNLKGDSVEVPGFKDKAEAVAAFKKSVEMYKKKFAS